MPTYLTLFIINFVMLINLTLIAGIIPLIERKYLSLIQRRVGPNFVGYKGRLQFIADALKLFVKGVIIPYNTNSIVFVYIPAVVLSLCYLFWVNTLWTKNLIFFELEHNLLYLNLLSLVLEFFIILTGFVNKNKYSFFSSIRSIIILFSVELILALFTLLIIIYLGSFNFSFLFVLKEEWALIFNFSFLINLLFILLYLETCRAPFDLNEAESELITGFHVEYSSFLFGLYYLAEYFHLFFFNIIFIILLF